MSNTSVQPILFGLKKKFLQIYYFYVFLWQGQKKQKNIKPGSNLSQNKSYNISQLICSQLISYKRQILSELN